MKRSCINIKRLKFSLLLLFFIPLIVLGKDLKNDVSWYKDYAMAKEKAIEEEKFLLIFFSGSDWCKPCIKLKKYVIETKEFSSSSDDEFIMYNADFPINVKQEKKVVRQNETLAEKYNPEGVFPKVVVVNADGELLAEMGYKECSPNEYFGILMSKIDDKVMR